MVRTEPSSAKLDADVLCSVVCTLYGLPMQPASVPATSGPTALRSLAEVACSVLAEHENVIGVCLIGSVARGNERAGSDIDLVVLCEEPWSAGRLAALLPNEVDAARLALLPYTPDSWQRQLERGDLFLMHVASEGVVLFDRDGRMNAVLTAASEREPDVRGEKARQLARLNPYRDPTRLNGNCLFALARVFSVAKAIAIARTIELGEPTFVKEEAFATLARRRPHLARAVDALTRLRPFYDLTLERFPQPLPFDYHGAECELAAAIRAVQEISDG